MSKTRIALMLPGAVSLGAYEGGALAALLSAVQASNGELVVDVISSASAGSITALVASRALLRGADPVDLMRRTWVDLPNLKTLKSRSPNSPLSMAAMEAAAKKLLSPTAPAQVPDGPTGAYRQVEDITISMALTALGGLTYQLARLQDPSTACATSLLAQTNIDWFSTTMSSTGPENQFVSAIEGALASGSTPVGFPPKMLDRSDPTTVAAYKAAGITDPNSNWHFWYSDGGDLDNAPFGRVLDLIADTNVDPADDRFIVLIQMTPPDVTWSGKWFDPNPTHVPTWLSTLWRVSHLRGTQTYYDDLRTLEKTNTSVMQLNEVTGLLQATLDQLPPDQAAAFSAALAAAAAQLEANRAAMHQESLLPIPTGPVIPQPPTLLAVLEQATGLRGKTVSKVEIIGPDPKLGSAADQLAGDYLHHFGGFMDVRFRQSDFMLGYANAMQWLEAWLPERIGQASSAAVMNKVSASYAALSSEGWKSNMGMAGWKTLTFGEKLRVLRLGRHMLRVTLSGLRRAIT